MIVRSVSLTTSIRTPDESPERGGSIVWSRTGFEKVLPLSTERAKYTAALCPLVKRLKPHVRHAIYTLPPGPVATAGLAQVRDPMVTTELRRDKVLPLSIDH